LQRRQRSTGRRVLRRTAGSEADVQKPLSRRTVVVITTAFLAVITISIFIGLYFGVWKNLWLPVITVNGETIDMDYLLRRMKYVDMTEDTLTMLYEVIPDEMLIRQGAPRYGIEVTPDDIDEVLRDAAKGNNETISETEFRLWYQNELNNTKLSDAEYREWIGTKILEYRLHEYLIDRIPTAAEQIHLYIIILPSYEEAESTITRIQEGEDFSELAHELSIDTETGEQGGDAGWWPEKGGLDTKLERVAFDLEIGKINDIPIGIHSETTSVYATCMVIEKQPLREIEEDKLYILQSEALHEWLYTEKLNGTIFFSGMDWNEHEQRYALGSETLAWINLQLAK